jgi:uncharacterized membrane protein YhaH (DUF805 family)
MGFLRAVAVCLWKSIDFHGRAPRSEFWYYSGFWTLACAFTSVQLNAHNSAALSAGNYAALLGAHSLVLLVPIVLLVPFAAVAVRRLHDINVSGWWLISATVPVPIVDLVVVGAQVVCFARPGTVGENRYGPDPRQVHRLRRGTRAARHELEMSPQ